MLGAVVFLFVSSIVVSLMLYSAYEGGWTHFLVGNKFTVGDAGTRITGLIGWPITAAGAAGGCVTVWRFCREAWTGIRRL